LEQVAYTAQLRTYVQIDHRNASHRRQPTCGVDKARLADRARCGEVAREQRSRTCVRRSSEDSNKRNDRARIDVPASTSKVANVVQARRGSCEGGRDLFSTSDVVADTNPATLKDMELINVLGLLKTTNHLDLGALQGPDSLLTLAEGETATTTVNNLQLGTLVADLVGQLTNLLFGGTTPTGAPSTTDIGKLTDKIWEDTATVCAADTSACRALRLNQAKEVIAENSANSGLLTGILSGIGGLLTSIANDCSGVILLGGGDVAGCKNMIKSTLSKTTASTTGGQVSNTLTVLTGLLKPVLDAVGASVLTPLLQNVLGISLGQVDVNLKTLDCKALPMLVY
jgi:hypothetical protein